MKHDPDIIVVLTDADRQEAARVMAHANLRENWITGFVLALHDPVKHLGIQVIYSILIGKNGKPGRHMVFWLSDRPDCWAGRDLVEPIARLYGFTGPIEMWNNDCQTTSIDGWNPLCVLTLYQPDEALT
jgi:hypothetical protein